MDLPATPSASNRCTPKLREGTPNPPSSQACRLVQDDEDADGQRPPPTEGQPFKAQHPQPAGQDDPGGGSVQGSARTLPEATPISSLSAKLLKARLIEHGIDVRGCTEKSELDDLWVTYDGLRQKPLSELRERCAAVGELGRKVALSGTVDECARFLCSPEKCSLQQCGPPQGGSHVNVGGSSSSGAGIHSKSCARGRTATAEILRILRLKKNAYRSLSDWGIAVLNCGRLQHQHAFRELMRTLHPDRIGASSDASKAIELVKEAKEACERASLHAPAPSPPVNLTASHLCREPGRRRILIKWGAAPGTLGFEAAPIKRYIVQVFDPAFGRAIKIADLESDYSEELRRFVPVEELRSYVLDEEHLQKMPSVFRQSSVKVQIAAASDAGQSAWVAIQIPLPSTHASRMPKHR